MFRNSQLSWSLISVITFVFLQEQVIMGMKMKSHAVFFILLDLRVLCISGRKGCLKRLI